MVVTVVVILTLAVCAGTGAGFPHVSQKAGYQHWQWLKMHLKPSLAKWRVERGLCKASCGPLWVRPLLPRG